LAVREAVIVLAVLALTPAALGLAPATSGASIDISTESFSPNAGPLIINGEVGRPARVGVRLANLSGRVLGWLDRPARRSRVLVLWDGTLGGRPVRDGYYQVELVAGGRVVDAAGFHLDRRPARLDHLRISSNSPPFAGDGALLATLSPNGDGFRDYARIHFDLSEAASVTLDAQRTTMEATSVYTRTWRFRAGPHSIGWLPADNVTARTYQLALTTADLAGNTLTYGSSDPYVDRSPRAPVVRVQGVDAMFLRESYEPNTLGALHIATDADTLTLQAFRTGPERFVTYADYLLEGEPVTDPVTVSWQRGRDSPRTIAFQIGNWPSGLYFVKLTADDDRVGYAIFVVRPTVLGLASRVAVVFPTNTWQAYNFWDADGDGWGDTWYAGPPHQRVPLDRPYLRRGVPPFFYRYDQGFLHWLYWTGKTVDFLTESDLDSLSGEQLAAAYDLVVFPGHTEYVTDREYGAVQRYRDLGGNLIFLSANNFFWRVTADGTVLTRTAQWRDLGQPEARLIGVQYLANDRGERQGLYSVLDPTPTRWLWEKTNLAQGSTFGELVGGYGIEIDHTSPDSPPGTIVVAEIPDLFGAGLTGQMTYYEASAGAKVFAAGALDFGGSALLDPVPQLLENLWARLSRP
jgi:N,N-dimethylformamidase beta subunit-like protein